MLEYCKMVHTRVRFGDPSMEDSQSAMLEGAHGVVHASVLNIIKLATK